MIGTGAAGSTAAFQCRSSGWNVAIIDFEAIRGTCALRGCGPKKVLVGAAELRDRILRMDGKGMSLSSAEIDWPALIRFKRTFTDPVPQNRENGFSEAGIRPFHGRARFLDRDTLQVGDDILTARHIVIAAGAMPAIWVFPANSI